MLFDEVGSKHVNGQRDCPTFARLQRAYADDPPSQFFATIILDGDDNGVFPCRRALFGVSKSPLDAQRRVRRLLALFDNRFRVEAKMVMARRADARAFENRRLAVRTRPRPARSRNAACVHELSR
jgi:hypothetical protein